MKAAMLTPHRTKYFIFIPAAMIYSRTEPFQENETIEFVDSVKVQRSL